jgi:hypothetical protein
VPTMGSTRSSTCPSFSLANISFSIPLPSSLSSTLRSGPHMRSIDSATSANTNGSDLGDRDYSPALDTIEDFEGMIHLTMTMMMMMLVSIPVSFPPYLSFFAVLFICVVPTSTSLAGTRVTARPMLTWHSRRD